MKTRSWISKEATENKIRIRLLDLDQAKAAVLNSLGSGTGLSLSVNSF
jgi:hypothetical protein